MPRVPAPLAVAFSALLHAVALVAAASAPRFPVAEDVPLEIEEVAPPPAAPPAKAPARRVAVAAPRDAPPAPSPPPSAPPPPNVPPPDGAPPPERAAVRVGVSLSSSTVADGVASPVGNTLYGEMPRTAPDPAEVRPYRSDRYLAPTLVTALPRPIGECRPPTDEYPAAALRLGFEGVVVLVLTIDETGAIADVRVVQDPGHGLGEAAAQSVRRHCRFEPARRGDERVATSFRFKVRFELP